MAKVKFISRADDLGSSRSANAAIDAVTKAGFIKNVSVMAPCAYAGEAAELLARRRDICFGMHTTLNSEWDKIKWGPVLPLNDDSGLVDRKGQFLPDPILFCDTRPDVGIIMKEVNAQLERLNSLGFDIRYVDSHMLPELFVEGLDEAMQEFIHKKGLIDHMCFYSLPPGFKDFAQNPSHPLRYLKNLPSGQYFLAGHPAYYGAEMLETGNENYSGETVAAERAREAKIYSSRMFCTLLKLAGCQGIRYDEAKPLKRLEVAELKAILFE
jgi:hypothetical protein